MLGGLALGLPAAVAWAQTCPAPGPPENVILLQESFDTQIPSSWRVVNNVPESPVVWRLNTQLDAKNYTKGTGTAATVRSDIFPNKRFDTELRTPTLRIPNNNPVYLSFRANYQDFDPAGADFLSVDVSLNGGASWIELLRWNEDHGSFFDQGGVVTGENVTLELTPFVRRDQEIIVRWRYYDVGAGLPQDWYAQIDDVEIQTTNARPVASPDEAELLADQTFVVPVLANDCDPDGDPLLVFALTQPTHGTVSLTGQGRSVRYRPAPGFFGTDAFTYIVTDRDPSDPLGLTAVGRVAVTVQPLVGTYSAVLSGQGVVPAAAPGGRGAVAATLSGNTLSVIGSFENLAGSVAADGVGLYEGAPGLPGALVRPLVPLLSGDARSGSLGAEANTFELTPEEAEALRARRLFVRVHSAAFPEGEVRGQLLPTESVEYRALLSEPTPLADGPARGVVLAEVAPRPDSLQPPSLVVTGSFERLSGPPRSASAVFLAFPDPAAGDTVRFPLSPTLAADGRSGVLAAAANTFTLSPALAAALAAGTTALRIETTTHPEGELEGWVVPRPYPVYEARIDDFHTHGGPAAPRGKVTAVLNEDEGRVALYATFPEEGIAPGSHLYLWLTPPGGPHNLLFDLTLPDGAPFADTLTVAADVVEALRAGRLAAGLGAGAPPTAGYTLGDPPPSSFTGQLLPLLNVPPEPSTPALPGTSGPLRLAGNPITRFAVAWSPAADANANPVRYTWQLFADAAGATLLLARPVEGALGTTVAFGALDAVLAQAGLSGNVTLYHRVVTSDGSLFTAGALVPLPVERGLVEERFALAGVYPNPLRDRATLRLDLPRAARVAVRLYDAAGREVALLPEVTLDGGDGRLLPLDAAHLAPGLYLYRVVATTADGTFTGTGRLLVVR